MNGRWMIAAAGLACLLTAATAGCVTRQKYDDLHAAWRNASDALKACEAEREELKGKNRTLLKEMALRDGSATDRDKRIKDLEDTNAALDKALKEVVEKYKRLAGRPPQPGARIDIIPAPVHAALKALADENADLMEYLPAYGMLKLKSDLTFDKGSATVKTKAVAALKKLATIVNTPVARPCNIDGAGHTDDSPLKNADAIRKHGTNGGLSCHRALAVVKSLFEAGVGQKRMGAAGFSKYHPIAPNAAGNKGNPLNRRVEIWIVPSDRFLTVTKG